MKLLKWFLLFVLIIGIVGVLAGGYFGFIPGLNRVFGSDRPQDLGVAYTQADFDQGLLKSGMTLSALPPTTPAADSLQFQGSHPVDVWYSPAELTAHAYKPVWRDAPLTQVQILIHPDGTAEASGLVSVDLTTAYLIRLGISPEAISQAKAKFHIPSTTIPFYVKGTASVTDNQVSLEPAQVKLARLPIPGNIVTSLTPGAENLAEQIIDSVPGLYAAALRLENGRLYFQGTLPDTQLAVEP